MKKKIVGLLMIFTSLFSLTGCGADVTLDLEQIKIDLENLKTDQVNRVNIAQSIANSEYMTNLVDVYEYDLEEYGLTKDYISFEEDNYDFSFGVNEDATNAYFVGNIEDEKLITELDNYFSQYNSYKTDKIGDYTIYVASTNDDEVLKKANEDAYSNVYNNLMYAENTTSLNISSDLVSEYLIATPMFITSAEQYIIIKPEDGKKEAVKSLMDVYMTSLQTQWDLYLPAQAKLVREREEVEIGNYLVYIISSANDKVLDVINSNKK